MRRIICFVLVFCFCVSGAFAETLVKDHLEVPPGIFNNIDILVQYESLVKRIELKDSNAPHYARMIVLPSFEPEWVVTIPVPQDGASTIVEYVTVDQIIWANKQAESIKVIQKTAVIPDDLAVEIRDVWKKMLMGVRHSDHLRMGLDGVRYDFSSFFGESSYLLGTIWSPEDGTLTAALTNVGELLKKYVLADEEGKTSILKDIQEDIDQIKKGLNEKIL